MRALKVYNGNEAVDGLASEADNRIVGTAVRLQKEGELWQG